MARSQRLLDDKTAGATRGSQDYQVHCNRSCVQFLKLKLQVVKLEVLEASTYSARRSEPPGSQRTPIAEPSGMERLASPGRHIHPAAGSPRLPAATRGRHDPFRVRSDGGPVAAARPTTSAQRPG